MARNDKDTEVQPPHAVTTDFVSGEFRTRFATQAIDLAELFKLVIGSSPLTGPVRFHVELSAPDGPSTGGGVQSVQHVRLVPEDGGATLVAGSCDQSAGACELRALDYLDGQHHQRFERSSLEAPPAPSARIDRKHYDQLLERLRVFFAERDLSVRIVNATELPAVDRTAPRVVSRPARASSTRGIAVLLGALLGLLVAFVIYRIVRH